MVREGRAPHPDGTVVPRAWGAGRRGAGRRSWTTCAASVGGQQQGMVCLDEAGAVVRPAVLWNDTRSAARRVDSPTSSAGRGRGPTRSGWCRWPASPSPSCAGSPAEPDIAARTAAVVLPHDWLTCRLRADRRGRPTTDRGEASGTGYWSPATGEYRRDLVRLAFGRDAGAAAGRRAGRTVGRRASGARARGRHRRQHAAPRSASACARATWWCRWVPRDARSR